MIEKQALKINLKKGYSHYQYSGLCYQCGKVFYAIRLKNSHCSLKCAHTSTSSGMWKGGRFTRNGYVFIGGQYRHPRSYGGYVAEHILVMEKFLGRSLTRKENIHHRNGIRSDNKLKNLELWVKPQLAGQRVFDLIKFVVNNYRKEVRKLLSKR